MLSILVITDVSYLWYTPVPTVALQIGSFEQKNILILLENSLYFMTEPDWDLSSPS